MIAVDIGSNSLRAVKIDCDTLEPVFEREWIVRTAEELESRGVISDRAKERIKEALCQLRELDEVKAVATEAFRRAKNAKEVIEEIKEACGVEIEVITPQLESYYSLRGVEYGLKRSGYDISKFVVADIGGGSTEIILKHKEEFVSKSFPIGILTTIERYKTKEEMVFGIKRELKEVKEYCLDLFELFGKPKVFVGTGGTPTTVAALKLGLTYESFDKKLVDGIEIGYEDIKRAYKKLFGLPKEERAKLVGTGREDAVMAGLVILEELMHVCGYGKMVVIDEGVREGLALEFCSKKS